MKDRASREGFGGDDRAEKKTWELSPSCPPSLHAPHHTAQLACLARLHPCALPPSSTPYNHWPGLQQGHTRLVALLTLTMDMASSGVLAVHHGMDEGRLVSMAAIPPPQTPMEPMEYLSRSWSVSAEEISQALLRKGTSKRSFFAADHRLPRMAVPETETSSALVVPAACGHPIRHQHLDATRDSISCYRHSSSVSKWFQYKETAGRGKNSRKEKARADRAQVHAMVSVAQVSAAVAAVTATPCCDSQDPKIAAAMASATELLASYCAETAQLAGAGHERVSSAVRSAVDVAGPGDLVTLTAAAATALRGAAILKKRVQRETRSNASVLPYEKAPSWTPDIWCKEGKRCGLWRIQ